VPLTSLKACTVRAEGRTASLDQLAAGRSLQLLFGASMVTTGCPEYFEPASVAAAHMLTRGVPAGVVGAFGSWPRTEVLDARRSQLWDAEAATHQKWYVARGTLVRWVCPCLCVVAEFSE